MRCRYNFESVTSVSLRRFLADPSVKIMLTVCGPALLGAMFIVTGCLKPSSDKWIPSSSLQTLFGLKIWPLTNFVDLFPNDVWLTLKGLYFWWENWKSYHNFIEIILKLVLNYQFSSIFFNYLWFIDFQRHSNRYLLGQPDQKTFNIFLSVFHLKSSVHVIQFEFISLNYK